MSGNVTLAILSAAAVAAILPSPHSSAPYVSRALPVTVTPQELHNYAEALVEVRRVQRNLKSALAQAPAEAAPTLREQANVAIAEVLLRHQFRTATFNRISHQVDRNPMVRRTVRQFVMQERLGI